VSITLAASSEERKRALAKAPCTAASMEACGKVDKYLAVTCMLAVITAGA
jgi:phenylpyruvate tautomerase PptA (4-oxalocrotonate tautomerase family)